MTREDKIQKVAYVLATNGEEKVLFHLQVKKKEVGLRIAVTAAIEETSNHIFDLETEESDPVGMLEEFHQIMEEAEWLVGHSDGPPPIHD